MPPDVLEFEALVLAQGAHGKWFTGEACLVECSNLIAAGRVHVPDWSPRCPLAAVEFADDHPSISRVIRQFAIGLNDAWSNADRQRLKPYATRILCTATSDADEEARAWMATDWLVRVHAPAFLRLAGLTEQAEALESLARITDATLARAARPAIDTAHEKGVAAWDAAGAATWAWAAAGAAAWAAARAAVGAAIGAAPGDDAAREAARAAAGAAAAVAGEVAAAAGAALRPTVEVLQASALELLDSMIAVGQLEPVR